MKTDVRSKKTNLRGDTRKYYCKNKVVVLHNEFMEMFCIDRSEIIRTSTGWSASKKIYKDSDLTVDLTLDEGTAAQIIKKRKIETTKENVNKIIEELIMFSRQSYLMYIILFDYYKSNEEKIDNEGYLVITLKEIHQMYRNKTLDKFRRIHQDTMDSYLNGLEDLHIKKIKINLGTIKTKKEIGKEKLKKRYIKDFPENVIDQNLIEYELIPNEKKESVSVKYKLGEFGKLMRNSKKMSSILPIELIQLNYKEISKFYIGMYISRLIYMSRKQKENYKSVSIKHILENIMCFNLDGSSKGINKYQEIKNAPQKTKLINTFVEQLKYVLDLFTRKEDDKKKEEITEKSKEIEDNENKIIKDYEISVDKITSKNYDWDSTVVKLKLR